MKYILFDVAGTLLYKPDVHTNIQQALLRHGFAVDLADIKFRHKMVSESIFFPDRTDETFYQHFNTEFLYALGIVPEDKLMLDIYNSCSYLKWEQFADANFLERINIPVGIISNFNSTLKERLKSFFDITFADVFVSEELGVAKPKSAFYEKALEQIGIDASEIIYVGDSVKLDLAPAQKLGIKTFLIDRDNYFPAQKNRIGSLYELEKWL